MEPSRPRKNARGQCTVEGCTAPHVAKGLCDNHYRQERQRTKRLERHAERGPCPHCGGDIPLDRRGRNGVSYCSRKCKELAHVESGEAAKANLRFYYRSRYGLTIEEADAMRAAGCWICGATEDDAPGRHGRLHIDHCHETGRVRGALCHRCNVGLGQFRHDAELLRRALEYLTLAAVGE